MPDNEEELTPEDSQVEETEVEETEVEETPEDSQVALIEKRIAALEQAQLNSVTEIRRAVGRVQSLADQLNKVNDPQKEAKLRTELAGVSDLLSLVTDSIDETILPRDVKRKVADAQAATRAAAVDADIARRVAEATAAAQPVAAVPGLDANALEAAVVAQIRGLGLNDTDPAFDWGRATQILASQGQSAMWSYFAEVEKTLLEQQAPTGPQRRPKTAAPKTVTPAANSDITSQLEAAADSGNLDAAVKLLRELGINT